MRSIILMAETGSDINAAMAAEYGIEIVPMHVSFDGKTYDDGTFPVRDIVDYYKKTGKTPTTSGSTPEDFQKAFDRVHAEHPDAHIVYLAYSAVTTCSYQSAVIAGEGRDYVTMIDTRHVSTGQGAIVITLAEEMAKHPEWTLEQVIEAAHDLIDRAAMCFMPDDLAFLRAGGRVSNVAALGARILSLHPIIEVLNGRLMATKKYRGKMIKVVTDVVSDYADAYNLDREVLWLIYTIDLGEDVRKAAEQTAMEKGFSRVRWIQTGGVITTHAGPGAFGMAGFSRK
ncbi:MAG: DegV family EDD domain-containing protein [Clostridia bacterium]|nr:DegV family EDD domain-containing protein [Clostridia bacterium]